jgi:hypothetical protein
MAGDATVTAEFRQTPDAEEAPQCVWQGVGECALSF